MARKSSISQLPPEILEQVHALINGGRTIDEITEHLHGLDQDVSRSAVGRHVQKFADNLKRYKEAQEVAGVWVDKLGENPNGDVGKLIAEMLKTVAFQTLANMGDDDKGAAPKDILFLANSIKALESANKLSIEREQKIREEVSARIKRETTATVNKAVKQAGLTKDTADSIRKQILGLD